MTGPAMAQGAETRVAAAPAPALTYPDTARGDTVDTQFGVDVADPYRWLEDDVRVNPEVAAWVAAENQVTDAYLDTLPGRDVFAKRMTELYNYERFGLPEKAGDRYFYTRNDGLQPQSLRYVRPRLADRKRLVKGNRVLGRVALGGVRSLKKN